MNRENVLWRLLRGSMARLASHLLQLAVQLLLVPFVVHSLGDRMYGLWTVVGVLVGYYGLLELGLPSAIARYLAASIGARDTTEINRVFSNAIVMYSVLGAIILAFSVMTAACASLFVDDPGDLALFRTLVLILGGNFAFELPLRVFSGILTAQMRFEIMALLRVMTIVIRTALIVAFLLNGYRLIALAVITVLASFPEKMLSLYLVIKGTPGLSLDLSGVSWKNARPMMSFGMYTLVIQIGDELRFNLDSMVITTFLGLAAVTHYRVASTLIAQSISMSCLALGVLLPYFSRLHGEKAFDETRRAFFASTRFSVFIASFVSFGLIAWGSPFIELWMGEEYLDAYPCLVVLSVGLALDLSQGPSIALLYAIAKHKYFALFNVVEGIANLGLSLILVRKYGIIGVAVGTLVPLLILRVLVQPIYVCRVAQLSYKEYVTGFAKSVGLAVLMLVVPAALTHWMVAPSYPALVSLGSLSAAAFVLGYILLGPGRRERWSLIPASLRKYGKA